MLTKIPFCKTTHTNKEFDYIQEAISSQRPLCDDYYTKRCSEWLETTTGAAKVLLTNSCTSALEFSALLAGLNPGDEVIMPSFTFVTTANAFVLYGIIPVFVDIDPNTLNIDPNLIEDAITPKTRAIVPMHYAGISCDMEAILSIAQRHKLIVIEDAAQCILAYYKNKHLGNIGTMGTLSFHFTKNVTSGVGGALLINNPELIDRAKILWQKGTNREAFFEGKVDKYTWVDKGSSFMPSEITAAFLLAQLESAHHTTAERIKLWNQYHAAFIELEKNEDVTRPKIPTMATHNGHIYYLLMRSNAHRQQMLKELRKNEIDASFHFIPLHSSPGGKAFCRTHGEMKHTDDISGRLLRLPLWVGLENKVNYVIECVMNTVSHLSQSISRV